MYTTRALQIKEKKLQRAQWIALTFLVVFVSAMSIVALVGVF